MISLEKMRDLLSDEESNISDENLELVRRDQYRLARIAFEYWRKEKKIDTPNER